MGFPKPFTSCIIAMVFCLQGFAQPKISGESTKTHGSENSILNTDKSNYKLWQNMEADHYTNIKSVSKSSPSVNKKKNKIKWGKIPPEDLAMTVYELDSSANAVVLNDEGETHVLYWDSNIAVKYKRHIRIKFLREEGFDYGDVLIPCYTYKRHDEIVRLDAQLFLPNGDIIKVDNIIKEKRNQYTTDHKFSTPKIEVGSILEYRYTVESDRWLDLIDWKFQRDIPVRHGHTHFSSVEGLEYFYLINNVKYVSIDNFDFEVSAVPAMQEEAYVTNMDDYRGLINFQVSGYLSGSSMIPVLSSWDKIAIDFLNYEKYGLQYRKRRNYKNIYDDALGLIESTKLTKKEKITALAEMIVDKVKWDKSYGLYPDNKLGDMYKNGTANAVGLNLMLLALLKEAKIPAVPIVISTRSNGKLFPYHPFVDQFNHTLIKTRIDSKDYFIDLTTKNKSALLPDTESLNYRGLMVEKNIGRLIAILPTQSANIFIGEFQLNELLELQGVMRGKYTNHNAIPERNQHEKDSKGSHWQRRLVTDFPEITIEDASCENLEDLEEDFRDQFSCTLPGAIEDVGEFLYVNPKIYSNYDNNPFTLKSRQYPIDYPYPVKEQFVFRFTVPEGYEVESIPESAIFRLEDNSLSFTFRSSVANNVITINRNFKIKNQQYPSDLYVFIKEIYDRMIEKMNELIVLKKIN